MEYKVFYNTDVIKKDIPRLSASDKKRIRKAIDTKLKTNPVHFGKPLRYSLSGHRRLRVGDFRVVYRINHEEDHIYISAIKHRKDVYE